jgi:hypothetical protein
MDPYPNLPIAPGHRSSRSGTLTTHRSTCGARMFPVFERMEDGSRRVLVLAQEESRLAGHNHIGTEHLLLGLMAGGLATDALVAAGVTLDPLREQVSQVVALSAGDPSQPGSPPFTPRAKKVLEIALRESLGRGSSTISPGDLLLGILREGESVAVQVLTATGVDLETLRIDVSARLAAAPPGTAAVSSGVTQIDGGTVRPQSGIRRMIPGRQTDVCSWCGRDTWDVTHFVSDGAVIICEVCITDAAEAMGSASEDEHRVNLPPRVFGGVPEEGAPAAIRRAVDAFMADEPDGGWGPFVEDPETLTPALLQARQSTAVSGAVAVVRLMRFTSPTSAWILLTVQLGPSPSHGGFPFEGPVRKLDGSWKVTRELAATMLGAAGIWLPPPS